MREMGSAKVFDGGSVLYLPQQITDTVQNYSAHIPGADGDMEVGVTLIYKRKKNIGERECVHLYNVLFKRIMHILMYAQMGRNYFSPEHKSLIPQHKLEVKYCYQYYYSTVLIHIYLKKITDIQIYSLKSRVPIILLDKN